MNITRRTFLSTTAAWATLVLAGCGQAAAPAGSPSAAPSTAAAKPAAPASTAASAKPAASAGTGASTKPAGSGSAAAAKPAASGSAAASPAPSAKPAAPGSTNAVKAAWVAITANMMPWPVAVEAGYFEKYGVNFNLQYVQGSVTAVQAMAAGDLQMISIAGSTVVSAQAVKQDAIMVAGYVNETLWRIMAPASITSIDQLRGKTIAVTKVGNADYFAWPLLAQKQGWKVEDFKFVAANDAPGQVTLVQQGGAQALAVSPPNDVLAQKIGCHMLLDETQYHEPEQQVGMVLGKAYLAQNRPLALNVLKATIEAIHRWKTDPAFAKKVIQKYLKQDDPAYIETGYSAYVNLFPQVPYPTKEGFAAVIEEVATQTPAAKSVTPDQCMDSSLVKELEDSGFIKQIYG
jgi:NitT/TauT family transport system substrate-binding protein